VKFFVTAIQRSRSTRRRCGKAHSFIAEARGNDLSAIEGIIEQRWDDEHPGSHTFLEIIDLREAREASEVTS